MKVTQKIVTATLMAMTLGVFGLVLSGGELNLSASAADTIPYQDKTDVQFTFNPTMTMTLDASSIEIAGLTQGNSGASSALGITVVTNDASGYTLYATVGNTSNPSQDLRLNGTDTTNKFTMLTAAGALPTSGTAGYWGYKTSASATTYNPIVLYTNATATTVNSSNGPTTTSTGKTSFYIGAYAGSGQASGDYTNVINFKAVTKSPANS